MIRDPPSGIGMIVDSEKAETGVSQSDLGRFKELELQKDTQREA